MEKKVLIFICLLCGVFAFISKVEAREWKKFDIVPGESFIKYDTDSVTDCGDYFTVWCRYCSPLVEKHSTVGKKAIAIVSKVAFKKTLCEGQTLIVDIVYADTSVMRMIEHKKPNMDLWDESSPSSVMYTVWKEIKKQLASERQEQNL